MNHRDDVLYRRDERASCWSTARLTAAISGLSWWSEEAIARGVRGRRVFCWHPAFWDCVPGPARSEKRVTCLFPHYVLGHFGRPKFIAGLAYKGFVADLLRWTEPGKPVRRVDLGEEEDALLHARRRLATRRVRRLIVGDAQAPSYDETTGRIDRNQSRKGVEVIAPLTRRLDPRRFVWVFLGKDWSPHAEALERTGWTVAYPGPPPHPGDYVGRGEGDVFLMLSRGRGHRYRSWNRWDWGFGLSRPPSASGPTSFTPGSMATSSRPDRPTTPRGRPTSSRL